MRWSNSHPPKQHSIIDYTILSVSSYSPKNDSYSRDTNVLSLAANSIMNGQYVHNIQMKCILVEVLARVCQEIV